MSLNEKLPAFKNVLIRYVEEGGHLIILSQEAEAWNRSPIIDGMMLTASTEFDERSPVRGDSTIQLLNSPNKIGQDAWSNWLFLRCHNVVSGDAVKNATTAVKLLRKENPVILLWNIGKGRITYVDLSLEQQLLNVHPGAFRLLANLISN